MLQQVTLDDIRPIALGAGILGTGGGGNPYLGSLHLRRVIKELGAQPVVNPFDLADDARVVLVGGIGAPTVSVEKLPEGTAMFRALRRLENHLGRAFDAVAIAEIGGANAMRPMIAARQAGLPIVDSDGMGRAFPEVPMSSFLFDGGVSVAPFAMVDDGENCVVVPHVINDRWAERIARNIAVSMGARAALAGFVMTGAQVKAAGIHYTLTLAHRVGHRVLAAQAARDDVPEAAADILSGRVIFRGKIIDVDRRTTRGFARGSVTIQRFSGDDRLHIEFQNEFLIARINGEVAATVPDLICIVTDETGEPVSTEILRYGVRVAVLTVPAPRRLKTPRALAVVGPRAFGYNLDFRPLPGESIGILPPEVPQAARAAP